MASSIWSPTRSVVLYGPVFRREVRVPWLPLFGPLLGPWSPTVWYIRWGRRLRSNFAFVVQNQRLGLVTAPWVAHTFWWSLWWCFDDSSNVFDDYLTKTEFDDVWWRYTHKFDDLLMMCLSVKVLMMFWWYLIYACSYLIHELHLWWYFDDDLMISDDCCDLFDDQTNPSQDEFRV